MGKKLSILDALFVGILLVIFGGVVLHAPLSVGLSTLWPQQELFIKSWKEVLLGVALVLAIIILTLRKQWPIVQTKFIYLIALFAALNVLLIPAYFTGFEATVAGLFINLRFFLFFVLVYVAIKLYPKAYRLFFITFIAGALVVLIFAILQVTVLPYDILKHLGYNETTIMPYLTVDQNINYIRINSTLRGPNPLGMYAVISLTVALVAWLRGPRKMTKKEQVIGGILAAGSVIALWASYSRSAALGALVAVGIVLFVVYGRRISKPIWISMAVVAVALTGSLVAFRDTQFVSQVILHEDPSEGNNVNSNDGHVASLKDSTSRMVQQPLGAGIGSTGSASLRTKSPVIIENQYLFVAHENGWIGLTLFLMITYYVLVALWRRRLQWLTLAVFASGVGLAVAGLFLPVWADDTVSIIWWGLAAMVLAVPVVQSKKKAKKSTKK
ncbi:MAG: O-antigen ligase family protein [Candidatus Saccharimonadaceae bacterium]